MSVRTSDHLESNNQNQSFLLTNNQTISLTSQHYTLHHKQQYAQHHTHHTSHYTQHLSYYHASGATFKLFQLVLFLTNKVEDLINGIHNPSIKEDTEVSIHG